MSQRTVNEEPKDKISEAILKSSQEDRKEFLKDIEKESVISIDNEEMVYCLMLI